MSIKYFINTEIEIPINLMPLISDADYSQHVVNIEYNSAGLSIQWNFTNASGDHSVTSITPAESGNYKWVNDGNGMYYIIIPASGGDTINNDAVGFGWITGRANRVLGFRGPIITFKPARVGL